MSLLLESVYKKISEKRQGLHACPKCGLMQEKKDTHKKHIQKCIFCPKCKLYCNKTHIESGRIRKCNGVNKQKYHCPVCHLRLMERCLKDHVRRSHSFSKEEVELIPELCELVHHPAVSYFKVEQMPCIGTPLQV